MTADNDHRTTGTGYNAANAYTSYTASRPNHAATTYNASGYPPRRGSYVYSSSATNTAINQPTSFNIANPEPNAERSSKICDICLWFCVLIGVGCFITLIVWLLVYFNIPTVPQVRVGNLNLSNFNATTTAQSFSGNWETRIKIRNPNSGLTMYFDHIHVSVNYKSDMISVTTLPPLVLGSKNETIVRAISATLGAFFDSGSLFRFDDFWVGMRAKVHYSYDSRFRPRRKKSIAVFCPSSTVPVSPDGTFGSLVGGWDECDVHWVH